MKDSTLNTFYLLITRCTTYISDNHRSKAHKNQLVVPPDPFPAGRQGQTLAQAYFLVCTHPHNFAAQFPSLKANQVKSRHSRDANLHSYFPSKIFKFGAFLSSCSFSHSQDTSWEAIMECSSALKYSTAYLPSERALAMKTHAS